MPIAREWEAKNSRHYCWAAPGKSCERAVWQQSAWSEWTTAKGKGAQAGLCTSAQVMMDPLKAFEHQHHWLLEAALRTGFPLWQLRLQILVYRAPRFLTLGTAVSDELQ
eukprot:7412990-Pyramimonas_sp.AAC.1